MLIVLGEGTVVLEDVAGEGEDPQGAAVHADKIGDKFRFEIGSTNFVKGVYLDFDEFDCTFGDNWFDLHGKSYSVLANKRYFPEGMTPKELEGKLKIKSCYDLQ